MMTVVMEREILHKMIDELPQERLPELTNFVRFFQEDDEPLTDSELEQMADIHTDPNMRSTWEDVWQKHLALA